ncbi:MAG: hypothetical protein ACRCX2_03000 [Paraclostridium sp.]
MKYTIMVDKFSKIIGRTTTKPPYIKINGQPIELTRNINLTKSKHKIKIDGQYYIREVFEDSKI